MAKTLQRGLASTNDGLLYAGVSLALRLAALALVWKYGAMGLLIVFRGILWVVFNSGQL
jgi:hypothetical protein